MHKEPLYLFSCFNSNSNGTKIVNVNRLFQFLVFSLLLSCQKPVSTELPSAAVATTEAATKLASKPGVFSNTGDQLHKYWYQGKGELNVYTLEQKRYQRYSSLRVAALLLYVNDKIS